MGAHTFNQGKAIVLPIQSLVRDILLLWSSNLKVRRTKFMLQYVFMYWSNNKNVSLKLIYSQIIKCIFESELITRLWIGSTIALPWLKVCAPIYRVARPLKGYSKSSDHLQGVCRWINLKSTPLKNKLYKIFYGLKINTTLFKSQEKAFQDPPKLKIILSLQNRLFKI